MELRSQKTIAAKLLKCGRSRVWIDPARIGDVHQAITSQDVRKLIRDGIIKEKQKTGLSNFKKKKIAEQKKKGRRKGHGSRKGKFGVRYDRKSEWMNKIRAQRTILKEFLKNNSIDKETYKDLYRKTKGGFFRSRAHLISYVQKLKR
ncbi:MAG: 50S ribosomal protein L19e [Candidatus Aenigmarchaeota archaeon]|nr:50S ribosomal protein L19e [Candidatus Aenigmarchaeota archaeon]